MRDKISIIFWLFIISGFVIPTIPMLWMVFAKRVLMLSEGYCVAPFLVWAMLLIIGLISVLDAGGR